MIPSWLLMAISPLANESGVLPDMTECLSCMEVLAI
jgi:hypothetical protein